jgi:hypothetical protein
LHWAGRLDVERETPEEVRLYALATVRRSAKAEL